MVGQEFHGENLGAVLLFARLFQILKDPTAEAIRLVTSQLTDGFFQKFGFEVRSRSSDKFAPGLDEVDMRLKLSPDTHTLISREWQRLETGLNIQFQVGEP